MITQRAAAAVTAAITSTSFFTRTRLLQLPRHLPTTSSCNSALSHHQTLVKARNLSCLATLLSKTTTTSSSSSSCPSIDSSRGYSTSTSLSTNTPLQPIQSQLLQALPRRQGARNINQQHQHQQVRYCSAHRRMCKQLSLDAGRDVSAGSSSVPSDRVVLPTDVKPTNYKLELEPDFEKFTFEGVVVVSLDVAKDTKEVSVNVLDIEIHDVSLKSGGSTQASKDITYDKDNQRATFVFEESLTAGSKATLAIKYTGQLNNNMCGFYRSSYKAQDGSTKYLATTQMEPTDARRAFPSFDEPALKATYDIVLIADKELTCLSNMNEVDSTDVGNGKKKVTFATSPPMSTYLVAFIIGDLKYIETNDFRVPVRVYATAGSEHLGKYSLDLAAKTLKFYEETFDSKFPLPKMDMVAIPDFSAGAMENWGLITYRLVDLLFDEKTSGAATKQRVAEVVQHELAHQWFGNLVTMDFWDGLWLNEGFATWMSWYSCNVFYPEWKVWESYVTDNLQSALGLDSLRSSHPIEVPVKRSDEVNEIFDAISYSKGSCVIRMITKYIGEDVFMEGIRRYLKKHAYGNTQTGDLWAALSEASGKDIPKMMDIWTKKVGFPVVAVTEKSDGIHVKQNRFLRTADVKPEEDETLYPIVLGIRSKDGVDEEVTFTTREQEIKLKDTEFFKLNADHSGLFRTSYSPERLTKLGEAAKAGLLTVEDKAGMIADAGALAQSGYQKTSGVLGLLKGFQEEKSVVVWDEVTARIGSVRSAWMFEDQSVKDGLKAFNRELVAKQAHTLGWEFKPGDDHLLQQFKALMFGSAGLTGDEKVIAAAKEMFEKFANGDKNAIHPNIRGSVYAICLKEGGQKEYDIVLNASRTAANSDERNTALRNIGRSNSPECIKQTLALSLSGEVKEQDIYLPLAGLRSHPEGVEALWAWAQENWSTLESKLPPSLGMLGTIVQFVTSSFVSEEKVKEIQSFFAQRSTKGFDLGLKQSLDAIRAKAAWLDRDREDVKEWLEKMKYSKK